MDLVTANWHKYLLLPGLMVSLNLSCSSDSGFSSLSAKMNNRSAEQQKTTEPAEDVQVNPESQDALADDTGDSDGVTPPEMISGAFLHAIPDCQKSEVKNEKGEIIVRCRLIDEETGDVIPLTDAFKWKISGISDDLISDHLTIIGLPAGSEWQLNIAIKDLPESELNQLSFGVQPAKEEEQPSQDDDQGPKMSFQNVVTVFTPNPDQSASNENKDQTSNLDDADPSTFAAEPGTPEAPLVCQPEEVLVDGQCIIDNGKLSYVSSDTEFSNMTLSNLTSPEPSDFVMNKFLINAKPGDLISFSVSWEVLPRPPDQYCPSCIIFYPYGFIKENADGSVTKHKLGCVGVGVRSPGQQGQASGTFTIPTDPDAKGTYYFKKPRTGMVYNCADTNILDNIDSERNLGVIIVK